MAKQFACPVLRRSYPGGLPLLRLDHIYFDREMGFERAWTVRGRTAMVASDHLPLVAEFRI
jgi:endonuclease/exonuclease/phosphatase family metal-dependent hydrolase